jgi:hypothetical protein
MHTLEATHDIRKVALWLGHASVETTEIYVRADPTEKLEAIDAMLPPTLRREDASEPRPSCSRRCAPSGGGRDYAEPYLPLFPQRSGCSAAQLRITPGSA